MTPPVPACSLPRAADSWPKEDAQPCPTVAHHLSIFRYVGGKSRPHVRRQIKALFPPLYHAYREPLCGASGVYFSINPTRARWINDCNPHLMAVYRALKDRPEQFINLCRTIPRASEDEPMTVTASGTRYPTRMTRLFQALLEDEQADPALRFYFLNRCSMNGRAMLGADRRERTYFSNARGWDIVFTDALERAAALLADTKVTCGDFEPLFDAPGDDVLIYADAPYVEETLTAQRATLYEYRFTLEDHRRLRDCVSRCQHRVVLSYDDHPLVRDLYREFRICQAAWCYAGNSARKRGRELIITNFTMADLATVDF